MSELSTEIDRCALCIHGLARADGRIRKHMIGIGAPVPSLLIAMATVLARRAFSFEDVVLLQRYTAPDDLRRIVQAHVDAGVMVVDDRGWRATDLGRDAAAFVIENQGELITAFWPDIRTDLVEEIVAGVPDGDVPAFVQQRDTLPEPISDAHRLLSLVTALRYLRADVHSAALARHGIPVADAPERERRWRAGEPDPLRERVEQETDADFVLRLGGREHELLAVLRPLPGEDPR